jgi:acylphosphatase
MNTQQIQAEKLDLIGWIYNIQDISIIEKLKGIQKNIVIEKYEASLKPMSKKELIDQAKEANKAIKNNDVTSQDDLTKETENW